MNDLRQPWWSWHERRRDRRIAAQFTERDLRDLGLTRGDLYRELAIRPALPRQARRGVGRRSVGPVATGGAVVQ